MTERTDWKELMVSTRANPLPYEVGELPVTENANEVTVAREDVVGQRPRRSARNKYEWVAPTVKLRDGRRYVQRVTVRGHKVERTIGHVDDMTREEAMAIAAENRALAKQGYDPFAADMALEFAQADRAYSLRDNGASVVGGVYREAVKLLMVDKFKHIDCIIATVTIRMEGLPTVRTLHKLTRQIADKIKLFQCWTIEGEEGEGGKRLHLNYIFALGTQRGKGEHNGPLIEGIKERLGQASPLVGHTKVRFMESLVGTVNYHCKDLPEKGQGIDGDIRWNFENVEEWKGD